MRFASKKLFLIELKLLISITTVLFIVYRGMLFSSSDIINIEYKYENCLKFNS